MSAHFDVLMPVGPGLGVGIEDEIVELKVKVNSGIAAVTPSQAIADLLRRDDVVALRGV